MTANENQQKQLPQKKYKLKPKKTLYAALISSILILAALIGTWLFEKNSLSIQLNGEPTITLEYGTVYEEQGAEAFISRNKPVDITIKGSVDNGKIGTYTVSYSAKNGISSKKVSRKVIIQDTTAPDITLNKLPDSYTLPETEYVEEGYSAYDACDGDLTDKVECTRQNNVILYTVTDSHGNTATATREIVYSDPVPPELSLIGDETINMRVCDTYTESGWTACDNLDGDLSDKVTVNGTVDTEQVGTYVLEYAVADSLGNTVSAIRTVHVMSEKQSDNISAEKNIVYLTFDDGPGPYTRQLLDILDKYNVKATFFTVNNPDFNYLLAEEAAAGHTVAIHSATHNYERIYSSKESYMNDLHEMENIILEYTGKKPSIIRFPGGSSNTISRHYCYGIMSELVNEVTSAGYKYFDWNVSSGDAGSTTSTEQVANNVIAGIRSNNVSIVLQHDIKGFSVNAVERIIRWGLANGYTFLPLEPNSRPVHHSVNN